MTQRSDFRRLSFRVGQGMDIHAFETPSEKANGETFITLGGVEIAHSHSLKGHSDADALTHAICDAILGALALGDIGQHFSDTDPANKNQNSLIFLQKINIMMKDKGYGIGNIDSTIVTEYPKIAPHIKAMQTSLANTLQVEEDQISIKATRAEKLGALGRQEGLMAMANVLLVKV